MIKALIVDDEAHVRQDLKEKILDHYAKDIVIVDEVESVVEALASIEKFEPDLLFLDVHLEDGTGFDILKQTTFKNFDIIFITGFDNNAIKAIKVGALDYILKPVDEDEFCEAVDKAMASKSKNENLDKLVDVSFEHYKGAKKKRVILKTSDSVYAIYEDDIIYCKADGNYTTFYTQQLEKIIITKSLKKVEEILSEDIFIRCHQSYIVNKQFVLKYNKQGSLIVHIDIKVPVSSRRRDYTLKKIFD